MNGSRRQIYDVDDVKKFNIKIPVTVLLNVELAVNIHEINQLVTFIEPIIIFYSLFHGFRTNLRSTSVLFLFNIKIVFMVRQAGFRIPIALRLN